MTIADLVIQTKFYDLGKVCGKNSIVYYPILSCSGDVNTGLVQDSNGQNKSGCPMLADFFNCVINHYQQKRLNTGHTFKSQSLNSLEF